MATCCASATLRLKVMHTPGHTPDSMCLIGADRVWTGDTLLIGATGRTDLPGGDAAALHDSLFQRLLKLDPALAVYPAHDYKGRSHSTIGAELASNPRLQQRDRAAFVEMMQEPEPDDAQAPDRGAARQHDRRQERRADVEARLRPRCRSCRWKNCASG